MLVHLLFVGTPRVGIDYMRCHAFGADGVERFEGRGPLIEQVREVEYLARAANEISHFNQNSSLLFEVHCLK